MQCARVVFILLFMFSLPAANGCILASEPEENVADLELMLKISYSPFFDAGATGYVIFMNGDNIARHTFGQEIEKKRRILYANNFRESRMIVLRKPNAKTPTWDGFTPAFVFDPMIWYFDPESRTGEAAARGILTSQKNDLPSFQAHMSPALRSLFEFLLESRRDFFGGFKIGFE